MGPHEQTTIDRVVLLVKMLEQKEQFERAAELRAELPAALLPLLPPAPASDP